MKAFETTLNHVVALVFALGRGAILHLSLIFFGCTHRAVQWLRIHFTAAAAAEVVHHGRRAEAQRQLRE